ncbi:Uncharacterized protein FKW44_010544 [Caligus rogercresseyi]|uniref:Transposase Tc1-like domain-containing protein n=1 Tax=Caligus rogercresseyi TaxID=217165 RepID=A0A7T8HHS2_CALRO|nr:Uncharacterized protein FKW44_010544 [Caligus rogercresseyi]
MIRASCKDMEIMKTACVARNTVKSIRSELEESNNDYERRSDSLRTPEFVEKLQKKVQEDPSKSCTKLAEELGVGNTTVRVCINEDLRYHFCKRCKGQILTEKAQENQFNKALKLHEPEHLATQLPRLQPVRLLPMGAVERDTDRTACNTMAELKTRITLCFKKLPRDQVRCACSRFRSRLKKVVEVRGLYFN